VAGPHPPVPGVIKLEFLYDLDGTGAANILHFAYDGGPPDAASCASLATEFSADWGATVRGALSYQTVLVGTVVTDLSSDMGASGQDLTARGGATVGNQPPSQVATVTKWPVALRYRGGHPKTFWPPLPIVSQRDNSNWTDLAATNFASLVNDFVAAALLFFAGSTTITEHVAVSYYSGHAPRVTPLVLSLGDAICDPRMGSQRRRRNQPVSI
jgi:hypothetical protein